MKWILTFLLFIVASLFVGTLGFHYPGEVQIIWLGYEVKLSAAVFLLVILSIFVMTLIFGRFLYWLFGLPRRWTSSFKYSQQEKANQILIKLFSANEAEETAEALEVHKKGREALSQNPLFLWCSGQVFEKADKHLEAEKCFLELTKNSSTLFLGLKGQIRAALHRGDSNQAYYFLKRAEESSPSSPWVLKHLLALARQKNKFEEQESLILRLEDLGCLSAEQSKKQIAQSQYQQALEPKVALTQKEAFLRQAHYLDPAHSEATSALALLLKDQGQRTYATTVIEETWAESPSQKLGDLYLKICDSTDKNKAFESAKELVKNNPQHGESLLFLARSALEAKLWREARTCLNTLLKMKPTADAYQLLARLELESKKDEKAALSWLEEGLQAPRHI